MIKSLIIILGLLSINIDGILYQGNKVTIQSINQPDDPVIIEDSVNDIACSPSNLSILNGSIKPSLNYYNFYRNQMYSLSFTGQEGDKGIISFGESTLKGNGYTNKTVSISGCKGDLVSPISSQCRREGMGGTIYYIFSNEPQAGFCTLEPNKNYYYNISNYNPIEDTNSCPQGQLCGFVLNFLRY